MRWLSDLIYSPIRNLTFGAIFVMAVACLGIIAYMAHGWSFGDALYMVVITIFTVGFEEVRPIDTGMLRTITIIVVVTGCTGMIFLTGALVQAITLSQVQAIFGLTRMSRQIEHLRNHIIVCGFGRTGSMVAHELRAAKVELVILESDAKRCAEARELGYLVLQADASEEATLLQAGIHRARALATVVASDAVNVFITLSARALNAELKIVARGELPATERKLLQAGANSVIMPAFIGAEQVASVILFPAIAGMIQSSERRRQMEIDLRSLGLQIQVVLAAEGSPYIGNTVEEIERMAERTFFIVAIEHAGTGRIEQPDPKTVVKAGDGITLLGRGGRGEMVARFDTPGAE
jgi:trk system potassium uptake protein TrkA/voltage-gated potassium channel